MSVTRKLTKNQYEIICSKKNDVGENEEMAIGTEVLARGRGIRITPAQRMEIIDLRKMNLPLKRIARKFRIHVQTVKLWIDRYREELNVTPHVNETGRP